MPDVGLCAQLACIWEATARKAGNVHRYADFADVTYLDFILSAAAIGPVLASAHARPVGDTVLECVQATRRVVQTNTNLGIVLLLAPLAAVSESAELRPGSARVLEALTVADSRQVYEAIRLAVPGGLGAAPQQDVRDAPTLPLRDVMALAADRDLIARQYANDFAEIFDVGVPRLRRELEELGSLEAAIIRTHLYLMSRHPDTLIVRKRGRAEAVEAARLAGAVLDAEGSEDRAALVELDAWLRAVGHQRNPGATADLVTACLFVLLRDGTLRLPSSIPWTVGTHRD